MTKPLETKPSFPPRKRLLSNSQMEELSQLIGGEQHCEMQRMIGTEYLSLAESEHRENEAYARGRADVWTEVKKDLDKIKADHGF